MKITFTKYPIDILICIAWSIVLIPILLFTQEEPLQIILSIPFIFFIPGYLIIATLFPLTKQERKIDIKERLILSVCLSIAIVALIGFILNFTRLALTLESILFSLCLMVISVGLLAALKWSKITPEQRYTLFLNKSLITSENKFDKLLTIFILLSLILTGGGSVYLIMNPQEVAFTEFILLGPSGKTEEYPTNLTVNKSSSVILEIYNHEETFRSIDYTIDIWLINQSRRYDNEIVNWSWDFGDGTKNYGKSVTHNYLEEGHYLIILTVKDKYNATASVRQNISIGNHLQIPKFSFSPSNPSVGDLVKFNITFMSIDSQFSNKDLIKNWSWNFGDHTPFMNNKNFPHLNVTHRYSESGYYRVNLTINKFSSFEQQIYIEDGLLIPNRPLVPNISCESKNFSTNSTIYFNASITKNMVTRNLWFLDKIHSRVPPSKIDVEKLDISQSRRIPYNFTLNRQGQFKMVFFLFNTATKDYKTMVDYWDKYKNQAINFKKVYRELHLWINVFDRTPSANFTTNINEPTTAENITFTDTSITPYSKVANWTWDFGDGTNISRGEIIGLKFDGIRSYIDCGTNINLQPVNGTIEAWIDIKNYMGRRTIFTGSYMGSSRRHPLLAISNNFLVLALTDNHRNEGHIYNAGFQTNTWYHIAATWNGSHNISQVSFYVNGSLKQTDHENRSWYPMGNTDTKRIGALEPPNNPDAFFGIIKDLRIYNRSLTDTEIWSNYNGNLTQNGLVSWWKMNDGGSMVNDSKDNNTGIMHDADWLNQATHRYSQPGTYLVTLKIINDYNQTSEISKLITVVE